MIILFCVALLFFWAFHRREGKLFATGVLMVGYMDKMIIHLIGDKQFSRKSLFFLGGILIYILAANVFSLLIDWALIFAPPTLHDYLRPINSDLSTTFSLSVVVILVSHLIMFRYR